MRSVARKIRGIARRVKGLSPLLIVALGIALLLGAAVVIAAAASRQTLTIALVGMVSTLALAGVIMTWRSARYSARKVGELATQNARLAKLVDATQRRLVATLEDERLAAAKRHQKLLRTMESGRQQNTVDQRHLGTRLIKAQRAQTAETEALLQLFAEFRPRAPMPSSGGFAMRPTGLLELCRLIEQRKPRLVVELGSGTSSVWIGYLLERIGGKLISLDHDADYAEQTRDVLRLHGLEQVVEVRHAALTQVTLDGRDFQWYDVDALKDTGDIECLLIDGPPQSTNERARYPALPMLAAKLADEAIIIADDAQRDDEDAIIKRWLAEDDGLTAQSLVFNSLALLNYARGR